MDSITTPRAPTDLETTAGAPPWWQGVIAGLLAALGALGVAELVSAISARWRSPVLDVGDRVIDLVPPWVKDFAIAVFGTNDKLALLAGIFSLLAVFAGAVGWLAFRYSRWVGVAGIALFGVLGMLAALGGEGGAGSVLPSLVGAAAGIGVLAWLGRIARRPEPDAGSYLDGASRRTFLAAAAVFTAGAVAAGAGGRRLNGRFSASESRAGTVLPAAAEQLAPVPDAAGFDVPGLSPFVTPNADFYRIDTALVVPQVPAETYELTIKGMVDREITLTYEDLLNRRLIESDITLTCVSNEVGGRLVGNARWLGVPLAELLEEAGVRDGADQIVGRSVDNYTAGFPVAAALDGRDAMVAIGMNGEPLPLEHGFPARLVVPGLYGYVSATKWLKEIELTTFDAFDHYWERRGWAEEAPIKTQSRIDTPAALARIPAGPTPIAGVAWAQTRGVAKVEVRVDDGGWQEAELAAAINDTTWRQWKLAWDATPGRHDITVRAADGRGETQPEERTRPIPDGAAGWHSLVVIVE